MSADVIDLDAERAKRQAVQLAIGVVVLVVIVALLWPRKAAAAAPAPEIAPA